jgi:hypothetical protein
MPDQHQLIPEPPEPVRHAVEIVADVGPWGGPTRHYRGARIEANKPGYMFGLFLVGHPMHLMNMGNWENMLPLIDAWIDGKHPPRPYSWKRA